MDFFFRFYILICTIIIHIKRHGGNCLTFRLSQCIGRQLKTWGRIDNDGMGRLQTVVFGKDVYLKFETKRPLKTQASTMVVKSLHESFDLKLAKIFLFQQTPVSSID